MVIVSRRHRFPRILIRLFVHARELGSVNAFVGFCSHSQFGSRPLTRVGQRFGCITLFISLVVYGVGEPVGSTRYGQSAAVSNRINALEIKYWPPHQKIPRSEN